MSRIRNLIGIIDYYISALALCSLLTPVAMAATATVTTLTVTPSNTLAAQEIATLTASVQAAGQPVTVGTVSFYDGKLYLGSVQVVRNASKGYTVGTATYKGALRIGTHSLIATFLPTATLATSSSAAQTVTVNGLGTTSLTLSAAPGSGTSTALTAVLSAYGGIAPTGSIDFSNQTSNSALGTVTLAPKSFVGSFSPLASFARLQPTGIWAQDLNGDGHPDLLEIDDQDSNGEELFPLLGKGDGTFTAGNVITQFAKDGTGIPPAISDFNGDGVPDLALASSQAPPWAQLVDDQLNVALGAGDGTFPTTNTLIAANSNPSDTQNLEFAATGDFNGDGIPDVAVTNDTSPTSPVLYIFPGNGDGTFGTPITSPGLVGVTSEVVQDFNGDGYADMAVTLSGQNAVYILLGKGDGTFQSPVSYATGSNPLIGTVLQSRGNGMLDLAAWSQSDNTVSVLLGNGDGTFQPQVTYSLAVPNESPVQILAADVTGDGLQDIVALYAPSSTATTLTWSIGYLAGNGDGTYQALVDYDASSIAPGSLASADFNRDGVSDLVAASTGSYLDDVLLSSQQGTVTSSPTIYGNGTQQVGATYSGDSNYSSSTSNTVSVTGAGNAPAPAITLAASTSTLSIAAGSTGTATLTVTPQNGYSGTVQFSCSGLPANSTCSFSPATVTPTGSSAATTTLTVATNVQVAANQVPVRPLRNALVALAFLMGFGLLAGNSEVNRRLRQFSKASGVWLMLLLGVTAALVLGCAGSNTSASGPSSPVTPPGTSAVTVKAVDSTSTSVSATTVLTVTISN